MNMSTGLHYLDLGIGVAVFLGIFWWMYVLTSRSHAERKLARVRCRTDPKSAGKNNGE